MLCRRCPADPALGLQLHRLLDPAWLGGAGGGVAGRGLHLTGVWCVTVCGAPAPRLPLI